MVAGFLLARALFELGDLGLALGILAGLKLLLWDSDILRWFISSNCFTSGC